MAKNSYDKPIALKIPNPDDGKQPRFSKIDFEKAVGSKAYEVEYEQAMRCPCSVQGINSALTNCLNCGGTGWFFVEKRSGWAVIQSFNRDVKNNFAWSEKDAGTVSITMGSEQRLGFMDKIVAVNMEADFSEIVKTKIFDSKVFSFLFYKPIEVEQIFLFQDVGKPLIHLKENDYTIEENKIFFKNSIVNYLTDETPKPTLQNYLITNKKQLSVSIRYIHFPTFNVIEINREMSMNRTRDQEQESKIKGFVMRKLPINAMAKRTHLIMDAPNIDGDSLFDNTVYK